MDPHSRHVGDAARLAQVGLVDSQRSASRLPTAPWSVQPPVDVAGVDQALGRVNPRWWPLKYSIPAKTPSSRTGTCCPQASLNLTTVTTSAEVVAQRSTRFHPDRPLRFRGHPGNACRQYHDRGTAQPWPHSSAPPVHDIGPSTTRSPWRGRCARRWMPPTAVVIPMQPHKAGVADAS